MNEMMSIGEIHARFQSEWVLLEDPETTESLEVKSGRLLWHSKDRDEVYRKASNCDPSIRPFCTRGPQRCPLF